uniref:Uncharacterized protein n=1 Tax=Fagus sylvatica TaxID=28930 RepID=A0A2N9J5J8_FAGSY
MEGKGRATPEVVGPRAGPSRAARDGHARVPKIAPFCHFKPRTVFSHPDRSSPNPEMPIWTPEGLARKPRRTTQQSYENSETEKIRAGKNRPGPSQHDLTKPRHIKYSQEEGPGHIFQAYLGGNVCAKILSDPLQLGPRAKTLKARGSLQLPHATFGSSRAPPVKPESQSEDDPLGIRNIPTASVRRIISCEPKLASVQGLYLWKNRQRKLSDGTKNVEIRHRELGQKRARTGTRFEKKRAGSKTHFSSRTAAFARRVFPARNKLIREPGCVGKITTPATTWNSRFADSIPRLTGIFIGKVHKNSSDTPTSGSHNSLVQTPIRANFIPLEKRTSRAFRRYDV